MPSRLAAIAWRKIAREGSVRGKLHSFCIGLPPKCSASQLCLAMGWCGEGRGMVWSVELRMPFLDKTFHNQRTR